MSQKPLGNESTPPLHDDNLDSRDSFVFLDKRGKRWPRFRRLMFGAGLLFFVAAILFIQTLVLPSQLTMPPAVDELKSRIKTLQADKIPRNQPTVTKPLWLDYTKGHKGTKDVTATGQKQHAAVSPPKKESMAVTASGDKEIRLGFYQGWDPDSFDSLKANADQLTHLCPDWLTFDKQIGQLKIAKEEQVLDLVKKQGLILLPLLHNLGDEDVWEAEAVEGWSTERASDRSSSSPIL